MTPEPRPLVAIERASGSVSEISWSGAAHLGVKHLKPGHACGHKSDSAAPSQATSSLLSRGCCAILVTDHGT
jgi:hypothetical protein